MGRKRSASSGKMEGGKVLGGEGLAADKTGAGAGACGQLE